MRRAAGLGGLLLTAALVAVLVAVLQGGTPGARASGMVGEPAPELSGRTLTNRHFRLDHRPGVTTVVNIWASWCGPCRAELPRLRSSVAAWSGSRVRLVTLDTRDGPVAARTLLRETHTQGLLAVSDPHGRRAVDWGATGVPETVVVDDRGVVRARWLGELDKGWLDKQLQQVTRRDAAR